MFAAIERLKERIKTYGEFSDKIIQAAATERDSIVKLAIGLTALNVIIGTVKLDEAILSAFNDSQDPIVSFGLHAVATLGSLFFYLRRQKGWRKRTNQFLD